jgi:hypothetical protein
VTAEETFEFAAAIAGVSIGLAALLLLALIAVIGTWRLFRHASDSAHASTRAALAVEELARHLESQGARGGPQAADLDGQLAELRESQLRLQELVQGIAGDASSPAVMDDIEASISRLDATVGQMAASLSNLVQLLERRQGQR